MATTWQLQLQRLCELASKSSAETYVLDAPVEYCSVSVLDVREPPENFSDSVVSQGSGEFRVH